MLDATAMLKNAPHPIFANDGYGVVRSEQLDRLTPEVRELVNVKLMGGSDPTRQNKMLDLARSLYK